MNVKEIVEIAFHRNGVGGTPFFAVRFKDGENCLYLAILTHTYGECYVICTDLLESEGVGFGRNSWRGDAFEDELRPAILKWEMEANSRK